MTWLKLFIYRCMDVQRAMFYLSMSPSRRVVAGLKYKEFESNLALVLTIPEDIFLQTGNHFPFFGRHPENRDKNLKPVIKMIRRKGLIKKPFECQKELMIYSRIRHMFSYNIFGKSHTWAKKH